MRNNKKTMDEIAMSIISKAGDAATCGGMAMDYLKQKKYDLARRKLEEGKEYIAEAHNEQTDIIQSVLTQGKCEYSLLFAHAQDTLMTIESELRVYSVLIELQEGDR